MYKDCASKRSSNDRTQVASTSTSSGVGEDSGYTLDVVGIYGFAGLGKSTLCKCLCDFYFGECSGNTYYVNLASRPSCQASSKIHSSSLSSMSMRMQELLSMLLGSNNDDLHSFHEVQSLQRLLQRQFSLMKDPIFLAIDNMLPESESQEEAHFYLRCKFPKGSKIFITSRSRGILENIFSQQSNLSAVINYMPALELKEARDIFVHAIPEDGISNTKDEVNEFVNMCTIQVEWLSSSLKYHPLMLKSLAAYIKYGSTLNLDWKGRLTKLKLEGITDKNNAWEKVFKMLEISYDIVSEEAKILFLDLALLYDYKIDNHAWIQSVYSDLEIDKIILQLQDLSFLVQRSQQIFFVKQPLVVVLPMVVDFAKHKASQSSNYLVVEDDPEWPRYRVPRSAYRNVSISRSCGKAGMVDLTDVEGVEVLHLLDNAGLQEVFLSGTTCPRLRSLIVRVPPGSSLRITVDKDRSTSAAGRRRRRGDGGPMWVELQGDVIFTGRRSPHNPLASLGDHLRNLEVLSLSDLPALQGIDLSSCDTIRLKDLSLRGLSSLIFIRGLNKSTNLQSLSVWRCEELRHIELCEELYMLPSLSSIPGLDKSTNLRDLNIWRCGELQELAIPAHSKCRFTGCESLRRISICPTSDCSTGGHGSLDIAGCNSLSNIHGLSQYTGQVSAEALGFRYNLQELLRELLESAEIDSSICKAKVIYLHLEGSDSSLQGLAAVKEIELEDAQNIGLFISALSKEQTADNSCSFIISCQTDGDCGCDKNMPHFFPLAQLEECWDHSSRLKYCCPQVRDFASLAQSHRLWCLDLSGCTSVEVWPDFATMTSLKCLDLSYTSLKEWPAAVLHLCDLYHLDIRGCRQLPAEELIKAITQITQIQQPMMWHPLAGTLIDDLQAERRDRCSVVDALDSHYPELIELQYFTTELPFLVKLLYDLWFGEYDRKAIPTLKKMRRLLCSEFFMSLPFYLLRTSTIDLISESLRVSKYRRLIQPDGSFGYAFVNATVSEIKICCNTFGLMAVALLGEGSIGLYNAAVNEDVKDGIIAFVKGFNYEELEKITQFYPKMYWCIGEEACCTIDISPEETRWLKERLWHAVIKMQARVPSVAAELGEDFIKVTLRKQLQLCYARTRRIQV